MGNNHKALRPDAMFIAIFIAALLMLQAVSVNAGTAADGTMSGTPYTVLGYAYWPNGTVVKDVALPVTVTNLRTGDSTVVLVDIIEGNSYADGTYRVDLSTTSLFPNGYKVGDGINVNCTYQNMWAHNQTVVGSTASLCDVRLEALPFGPGTLSAASGGTVSSWDGRISLEVPAGALLTDTTIWGVSATHARHGALESLEILPDGLSFSSPATLTWPYDGLSLGNVSPETLAIYTSSNGGPWEKLPGYVDTLAKQVVAYVSHFSNFSLGGAAVFGNQTGVTQVYPGATDVPILDITIINTDAATADMLEFIHVMSNSTDDSDITGISIWNDMDNDRFIGVGDVLLAGPLSPGSANFTLSVNIPADSALNLLVTIDVSSAATVGNVLDLYIPALGVGLTNAGLSEDAIDPAGSVTLAEDGLTDPHVVYGTVGNILGPIPYAWVNLTNNRTGATGNLITDDLGRYDVNIGFMAGGYADGDEIFIMANDTIGQTGWNVTYVDINSFGERCDIYIGRGPVASNETPANGSLVTDIYRNVTVNITSDIGVDLATIIIEVDGANYTWGDVNLAFIGDTLVFNTSGAVGAWADGQTVNVTLWQANDTVGNPLQNAPYSWWFFVSLGVVEAPANLTLSNDAGAVKLVWNASYLAASYNVYKSADRFAAWPWPVAEADVPGTEWTDAAGTYSDTNTYYYIVRAKNAGGESGNSSMGAKSQRTFTYLNPTLRTNLNWISMPYNSRYVKLSDIVIDIEGGLTGADRDYIVGAYYWNATQQQMVGITWGGFGWNLANDVDIRPGDGICLVLSNLMAVGQQFFWTIAGTDLTSTQNFTYLNPALRTNLNWISMPYSSTYERLSDIVIGIEGGLTGADRDYIVGAYYWNATQQQMVGITWGGFGWNLANDIIIRPDDGICLVLSNMLTVGQQFSWEPALISAPVPNMHYYD